MVLSDQDILDFIARNPGSGRAEVRRAIAPKGSETTIWRALSRLVNEGRLEVSGKARATGYAIAGSGIVRAHLATPYNRRQPVIYRPEFLDAYVPNKSFYLSPLDRARLHEAGQPVGVSIEAGTYARRILERLLVDLSWASSRMEGNTYDILQTEKLIRFGEEAAGKDRKEALMILNHKEAIEFIVNSLDEITLRRVDLFAIHSLLSDGLLVDPGMAGRLRANAVGISHSSYRPLDDAVAIDEEFDVLLGKAVEIADPFEQSFFLLVHIPYLQAFVAVNKRTSRVASNIPLLKADLAPMSFLTMDDGDYIDGLIGVYELNNVALLRDVYVDAYLASADKYRFLRAEVDTPDKAALVYRDFVREAVRRCVLVFHGVRPDDLMTMAANANIPLEDRKTVVAYVAAQVRGLHEGNVIRYRLRPEDLDELQRAPL
jgi:hypothetical protein